MKTDYHPPNKAVEFRFGISDFRVWGTGTVEITTGGRTTTLSAGEWLQEKQTEHFKQLKARARWWQTHIFANSNHKEYQVFYGDGFLEQSKKFMFYRRVRTADTHLNKVGYMFYARVEGRRWRDPKKPLTELEALHDARSIFSPWYTDDNYHHYETRKRSFQKAFPQILLQIRDDKDFFFPMEDGKSFHIPDWWLYPAEGITFKGSPRPKLKALTKAENNTRVV